MKKIIPILLAGGLAAASFSVFAQTSARHPDEGRSVDTGGAHPDSSQAEGRMPYRSTAPERGDPRTERQRYRGEAAGSASARHPDDGRSVDTGGGHPDSSAAEGRMNYGSVAPERGDPQTKRERYTGEAAAGAGKRHPEEGRSVDTGGAHPDSSQAEGRMPYSSPAPERERK
jgi:hypothetical protein